MSVHEKPGRTHPGVGVGVIVVKDGCLLMVRRAGAHGAGTWSVPGGWVEMWEDPLMTACREVLEETGVELQAVRSIGWDNDPFPDDQIHAVILWIEGVHGFGDPLVTEPEKCPEVRWVPLDEVRDRPLFGAFGRHYEQVLARVWAAVR